MSSEKVNIDVEGPLTLDEAKAVGDVPETFGEHPGILKRATEMLTGDGNKAIEGETQEKDEKQVTFEEPESPPPPEKEKKGIRKSILGLFKKDKKEGEKEHNDDSVELDESSKEPMDDKATEGQKTENSKKKGFLAGIFHNKSDEKENIADRVDDAEDKMGEAAEDLNDNAEEVAEKVQSEEPKRKSLLSRIWGDSDDTDKEKETTADAAGVVGAAVIANNGENVEGQSEGEKESSVTEEAENKCCQKKKGHCFGLCGARQYPKPAEDATIVKSSKIMKKKGCMRGYKESYMRLMSDGTLQFCACESFECVCEAIKLSGKMKVSTKGSVLKMRRPCLVLKSEEDGVIDDWKTVFDDFKTRLEAVEDDGKGSPQVVKSCSTDCQCNEEECDDDCKCDPEICKQQECGCKCTKDENAK